MQLVDEREQLVLMDLHHGAAKGVKSAAGFQLVRRLVEEHAELTDDYTDSEPTLLQPLPPEHNWRL